MPLRKLLRSLMEGKDRDYTNKEIAQIIGKDGALITKFFDYKNELQFLHWVKIVKALCPQRESDMILFIADKIIKYDSKQCKRYMMEYFSVQKNLDYLEKLVTSEMHSDNKENRDWAKAYGYLLRFQKNELDGEKLLDTIDEYSPSYQVPKLVKRLLKIYGYRTCGYFKRLLNIAKKVEEEIAQVKNDLLQEFFTLRLSEVLSHVYLFANADTKKARFYANNVINSELVCPKFKYNTYYIMGVSFLFESYIDFKKYIDIYLGYSREYKKTDRIKYVKENDLALAAIYWDIKVDSIEGFDILEQAHYLIKNGEIDEAKSILEKQENNECPFYLCYKGMAENDPISIMNSIVLFENKGDKFYAQIPKREINKMFESTKTA